MGNGRVTGRRPASMGPRGPGCSSLPGHQGPPGLQPGTPRPLPGRPVGAPAPASRMDSCDPRPHQEPHRPKQRAGSELERPGLSAHRDLGSARCTLREAQASLGSPPPLHSRRSGVAILEMFSRNSAPWKTREAEEAPVLRASAPVALSQHCSVQTNLGRDPGGCHPLRTQRSRLYREHTRWEALAGSEWPQARPRLQGILGNVVLAPIAGGSGWAGHSARPPSANVTPRARRGGVAPPPHPIGQQCFRVPAVALAVPAGSCSPHSRPRSGAPRPAPGCPGRGQRSAGGSAAWIRGPARTRRCRWPAWRGRRPRRRRRAGSALSPAPWRAPPPASARASRRSRATSCA